MTISGNCPTGSIMAWALAVFRQSVPTKASAQVILRFMRVIILELSSKKMWSLGAQKNHYLTSGLMKVDCSHKIVTAIRAYFSRLFQKDTDVAIAAAKRRQCHTLEAVPYVVIITPLGLKIV